MKPVVVITGGSSGIGLATGEVFAKKGYTVYELSRKGKFQKEINHITADVTKEETLQKAFEKIYQKEGHIDLLINNAGFGISGATEFTPITQGKALFDVNFFGAVACVNHVLPYLRKTKGKIMMVSSVAGALPVPFQSYYSASKAAINAISESIRNEVRIFGVSLCCVLPGDVKTSFTALRQKDVKGDSLYQGKIARSVSAMEKDEEEGMSPLYIGKFIYRISQKKQFRPFYIIGNKYRFFCLIARILPRRAVSYIMGKMYG